MKKRVVAVDIDEVLARHNHGLAQWHNTRYGTSQTEHSYFTDHWAEVWKVSHDETVRRAHEFHAAGVHRRLEVVPGAQESIKQLAQQHKLVVVTVRRKVIVPLTYDWLDEHFAGLFTDVRFVQFWDTDQPASKADICKEIGAEYLIDDNIGHCIAVTQHGIKALLFGDYVWNKIDALPTGVIRLNNWQAVTEYFNAR